MKARRRSVLSCFCTAGMVSSWPRCGKTKKAALDVGKKRKKSRFVSPVRRRQSYQCLSDRRSCWSCSQGALVSTQEVGVGWRGGGGVSRCSLIVPTDCAPLDADGAVSSITAMRWLNLHSVKPRLITYSLSDRREVKCSRSAKAKHKMPFSSEMKEEVQSRWEDKSILPQLASHLQVWREQWVKWREQINRSVEQSECMQNVC